MRLYTCIDWQVSPVETTYELAGARVRTNAQRINRFELPLYSDLVDVRTKRLRLLLDLYAEVERSTHAQRDSEYCAWRRLVSPGETCHCTRVQAPSLTFDGCNLPPVAPHLLPRSVPSTDRHAISCELGLLLDKFYFNFSATSFLR